MIDFYHYYTGMNEVHKLSLRYAVSYTLHFDELDNTWFYSISSAAPSENWIGKNRNDIKIAISDMIERLKSYA